MIPARKPDPAGRIAPAADVLAVSDRYVTIRCPYCGGTHEHSPQGALTGWHRHAPGCGLIRSTEQRAAGYWFRVNTYTTTSN